MPEQDSKSAKRSKRSRQGAKGTPGGSRSSSAERGGIRYGGNIVGKYIYRVRERHVAEHLAPLIRERALGAAKLDLVLRAIALPAARAGSRRPGTVLPRHSYDQLHDLARRAHTLGADEPGFDPSREVLKLKRKWVGQQLEILEERNLVRREPRPGKRPVLVVLKDDGSGEPFDDPEGSEGDYYITIRGAVIASGALAGWGAPELSAYLAATVAERYDPHTQKTGAAPGTGHWFRPLEWFADPKRRFGNEDRLRFPFSVPTLERGLRTLRTEGLVIVAHTTINPMNRTRLASRRNLYHNHFDELDAAAGILDAEEYAAELDAAESEEDDEQDE